MSQVEARVRRIYDVKITNGHVTVRETDLGHVYISSSDKYYSTGMLLADEAKVRQAIEALQDYLIAKHDLRTKGEP